jgi:hypothetical protein
MLKPPSAAALTHTYAGPNKANSITYSNNYLHTTHKRIAHLLFPHSCLGAMT